MRMGEFTLNGHQNLVVEMIKAAAKQLRGINLFIGLVTFNPIKEVSESRIPTTMEGEFVCDAHGFFLDGSTFRAFLSFDHDPVTKRFFPRQICLSALEQNPNPLEGCGLPTPVLKGFNCKLTETAGGYAIELENLE